MYTESIQLNSDDSTNYSIQAEPGIYVVIPSKNIVIADDLSDSKTAFENAKYMPGEIIFNWSHYRAIHNADSSLIKPERTFSFLPESVEIEDGIVKPLELKEIPVTIYVSPAELLTTGDENQPVIISAITMMLRQSRDIGMLGMKMSRYESTIDLTQRIEMKNSILQYIDALEQTHQQYISAFAYTCGMQERAVKLSKDNGGYLENGQIVNPYIDSDRHKFHQLEKLTNNYMRKSKEYKYIEMLRAARTALNS